MNDKTKNVLIIILSTIIVILFTIIIAIIMHKSEETFELKGKVIVADDKYVIIDTGEEDYLVNGIEETYEVGDEVEFTYKNKDLHENTNPKSIEVTSEKLLTKAPKEEKTQKPDESIHDLEDAKNQPIKEEKPVPSKTADEDVLEYYTNLESEFNSSKITDSLKSGFITAVDFIFYGGKIKGHTFQELSSSAKLKVLEHTAYFDGKIDTYFPGYKESISSTTGKIYTSVKNEVVSSYLNVTTEICKTNEEACTTAKETFSKIKTNLGLTWSLIKDIASDGVGNLKNWYEIWSGKQ